MSSVVVRPGDSYESIARRVYGDEEQAGLIRAANPGVTEPIEAGTTINAPLPPTTATSAGAFGPSEVAVTIGGERFRYWTDIEITCSIDAMDVLTLSAPFDPDDPAFTSNFRPLSFSPVGVAVGGAPLFSGVMMSVSPESRPDARVVSCACYSAPAVLNDCTAPASAYPVEWDGAKISTIARALAAPFGVSVVVDSDEGAVFERVALRPGEKILPFLIKLAQQRGLLVSSTARGELLFTKSIEGGAPVARLVEGLPPLVSVAANFNPQEYYSDITGIEPVVVGLSGSQYTVKNSNMRGVIRPYTYPVTDTVNSDIKAAVEAKAGRMFANCISYTCNVVGWRDPSGELWAPNTTITLLSSTAYVRREYEFLIKSVTLTRSSRGEEASLVLTTPGAFSSKIPEVMPWD